MTVIDGTAAAPRVAVVGSIRSGELPDDLEKQARAGTPRKVVKLLERLFYPPFVAATELHRRHGAADPESFGLFTVSSWDPSIPVPDYATEDAPDRVQRLTHFYTHPTNPTDWLRRMPNNPLCNICITTGFRGPTMHYTGGAESLALLTTVAISTLLNGTASAAMVLAFDPPEGAEHALAEESDSDAAAVLLALDGVGPAAEDLVQAAFAAPPGSSAVAALDAFAATAVPPAVPAGELG